MVGYGERGPWDGRGRGKEQAEDGEDGETGEEHGYATGGEPRQRPAEDDVLLRHRGGSRVRGWNGVVKDAANRAELKVGSGSPLTGARQSYAVTRDNRRVLFEGAALPDRRIPAIARP